LLGLQRICTREACCGIFETDTRSTAFFAFVFKSFEDETEVVDRMRRFRIDRHAALEDAPSFAELPKLKENLALESAVEPELAARLRRTTHKEERPFEIILIEEGLALQVIDFGLQDAIGSRELRRTGQQFIREANRGRELPEFLDQEFDAIQMGRSEFSVRQRRPIELDQRFIDPAVIPEDFAATIMGFGAVGMHAQGFVEPGKRLLDPAPMRGLHCLIQAIPIAILILTHSPYAYVSSSFLMAGRGSRPSEIEIEGVERGQRSVAALFDPTCPSIRKEPTGSQTHPLRLGRPRGSVTDPTAAEDYDAP
jgi:hypothetical protein